MGVNHVPHAYPNGRNEDQPCTGAFLHQRSIEVHHLVLLVDDQLGVAPDVEALDAQLGGDTQAIDERLIFGHIVGGGEMDADHVPHAYPKGQNEDQPRTGAFLHQQSIEVHHPVLLVNDCW